jgi:hypothetical protein
MPVKNALNLKSWICEYMRKNIPNPGPSLKKEIWLTFKEKIRNLPYEGKSNYLKQYLTGILG